MVISIIVARSPRAGGPGSLCSCRGHWSSRCPLHYPWLACFKYLLCGETARTLAEHDGNTIIYSLLAGSLAGITLYSLFHLIPRIAPLRGPILILGLLWIPVGLAYMLMQNLLIGVGELRIYNGVELAAKIGVLLVVVLIALLHVVTPERVLLAGLSVLGGSAAFILLRLRFISGGRLAYSLTLARETIAVGFRAYLISFFGFLVLRLDLLMVQNMLGPYYSGNYSIASTMADYVLVLPTVFGAMLFPKVSATKDVQQKLRLTRKASLAAGALLIR